MQKILFDDVIEGRSLAIYVLDKGGYRYITTTTVEGEIPYVDEEGCYAPISAPVDEQIDISVDSVQMLGEHLTRCDFRTLETELYPMLANSDAAFKVLIP